MRITFPYLARHVIAVTILLFFLVPTGVAEGDTAIAQQFQVQSSDILPASLVSIQKESSNTVVLSTLDQTDRLIGVVSDKPLVELSNGIKGIQVVTSGMTLALVSDINGDVKAGDRVTASPIAGVGMKASENTIIVGIAQTDLKSSQIETRKIKDKAGQAQTVKIGLLPLQVGVVSYAPTSTKNSFVPSFMQNAANGIAGHNVSPVRVLVAAFILLLLFISITVLLYSSVKSSIISIGRNPLSESAVRKGLLQVGLTVMVVLVLVIGLVYLVLTA